MDPSHYQNFAVTDDAVIFFFSQGELLPRMLAPPEASVPRAAPAAASALSRRQAVDLAALVATTRRSLPTETPDREAVGPGSG